MSPTQTTLNLLVAAVIFGAGVYLLRNAPKAIWAWLSDLCGAVAAKLASIKLPALPSLPAKLPAAPPEPADVEDGNEQAAFNAYHVYRKAGDKRKALKQITILTDLLDGENA